MKETLDNWEFERLYSRLFGNLIENQQIPNESWRYDPLDSKYPAIDGIIRRVTRESAKMKDGQPRRKEEYILVQLKGTRLSYPELKKELIQVEQQINSISLSTPILLIGLIVDPTKNKEQIQKAFIAAPASYLAAVGIQKHTPIVPQDLTEKIASILQAVDAQDARSSGALIVKPISQEAFFFKKGPHGWYSITNGVIAGRDISINWTIPRPTSRLTVTKMKGSPEIQAVAVRLPHPPYHEIPGSRQPLLTQDWKPPKNLQGCTDFFWVMQIQFRDEGVLNVEALLSTI